MSVLRSHNNKTRGGLGRVCATGMYRFIEQVKFPKFQTGIFVEWKAPQILRHFGWRIWLALIEFLCLLAYQNVTFVYLFCTKLPFFCTVLPKNCIFLSQSQSSNFFMYIIMTVNFRRSLIQSRRLCKRRQSVFPLFIGFVCYVIVVFCRCLYTRLWSLCWRRCLRCAKAMFSASRLSSSIRSPMNFNRCSPEEFQWKIFLGEDLQVLAVPAVLCHLDGKLFVINSPMVNIVSKTMSKHNSLSWIIHECASKGPEEFRVNKWIIYLKSHLEKCQYLSFSTIKLPNGYFINLL